MSGLKQMQVPAPPNPSNDGFILGLCSFWFCKFPNSFLQGCFFCLFGFFFVFLLEFIFLIFGWNPLPVNLNVAIYFNETSISPLAFLICHSLSGDLIWLLNVNYYLLTFWCTPCSFLGSHVWDLLILLISHALESPWDSNKDTQLKQNSLF